MKYIHLLGIYGLCFVVFIYLLNLIDKKFRKPKKEGKVERFSVANMLLFNSRTNEYSLIPHDEFKDAKSELKELEKQGWKVLANVKGYRTL